MKNTSFKGRPRDFTLSRSTCTSTLRDAGIEAAVHEADFGSLPRLTKQPLQYLRQLSRIRAGAVLHHEREPPGHAQAADRRRIKYEHLRIPEL